VTHVITYTNCRDGLQNAFNAVLHNQYLQYVCCLILMHMYVYTVLCIIFYPCSYTKCQPVCTGTQKNQVITEFYNSDSFSFVEIRIGAYFMIAMEFPSK